LVWRPSLLFDPSFQLTMLSVAAIVGIAFPLIEKLRSIGTWSPMPTTPFPPNVNNGLLRFCEMLYWRPVVWEMESRRQVWSARLFKEPFFPALIGKAGQRAGSYIFEGLLISVVVQMCLLPLLAVYFHRVAPVSLVLNLWVGAILAAESFMAVTAVVLSNVSEFLAAPVIATTEFLNHLMISVQALLARSEWSSWRVPNYPGPMRAVYVAYFVPLIALGLVSFRWDPFKLTPRIHGRRVVLFSFAALIIFAAIIVLHPFSAPRADGRLHLEFFDVGQGDAALVTFPDGMTLLVDGGGRVQFPQPEDEDRTDAFVPDVAGIGEMVVSPILWAKGYSKIDHILATHADADHIQGLTDVVANFSVGSAYLGRTSPNDPELAELLHALRERDVPVEVLFRGRKVESGGAVVEVLYPLYDASPDAPSDNDHSIVIRIVYGGRSVLLTGDIERVGEMQLLSGGGDLTADVVKAAHHGSRTSSTPEFVLAARPRYVVISVGRRSIFGHPHREVVERWQAGGAEVLTTGEKGMISFSTDGRDLEIRTYAAQK
jgi:competence protein ComEC